MLFADFKGSVASLYKLSFAARLPTQLSCGSPKHESLLRDVGSHLTCNEQSTLLCESLRVHVTTGPRLKEEYLQPSSLPKLAAR